VNDNLTAAIGDPVYLTGRLLDARGAPLRNASIEIWECDSNGIYLKQGSGGGGGRHGGGDRERAQDESQGFDANFQGFGRFLTGSAGEYCFRTIKPVPYRGRQAPHIHFKVKVKGRDPWTTQVYIKGHPGNEKDRIYRDIGDDEAKALVTLDFVPLPKSRIGELAARFDIVLDVTPSQDE
jgi:protocatechuate 3,4-dioxygenase beta subunit